MAVMAVLVPFLIGLEQVGLFAAVFSLPGAISSFIELYFLASINSPGLRAVALMQFLILSAIGALVIITISGVLFDFCVVLVSVMLFVMLLFRAFVFSLAIASGGYTRQIVRSELVVLASYLGVLPACFLLGQDGAIVPLTMTSTGLLLSSLFLWFHTSASISVLRRESRFGARGVFSGVSLAAALGKTFEDGFLTLQPFLLTNAFSAETAGFFRVMVTVLKGGFKLFPFRHDVVLREFSGDTGRNAEDGAKIRRACDLFSIGGVVLGLPIAAFVLAQNGSTVVLCVLGSGFVITALALFPAASILSTSVRFAGVAAVVTLALTAMYLPLIVFSAAFILLSFGVSRWCLRTLVKS